MSGVMDVSISDHSLIYAIRTILKSKKTHAFHSVPKIPISKLSQFNADFSATNWSDELSLEDPEQILTQFRTKLHKIQNKYATVSKNRSRKSKLPWINSKIIQLLKLKVSFLKLYRASRTSESKNNFIQIRNKCILWNCVRLRRSISNS